MFSEVLFNKQLIILLEHTFYGYCLNHIIVLQNKKYGFLSSTFLPRSGHQIFVPYIEVSLNIKTDVKEGITNQLCLLWKISELCAVALEIEVC